MLLLATVLACDSGPLRPVASDPPAATVVVPTGAPDAIPGAAPEVNPLCEPFLLFSPVHPTEGETVTATVACGNGKDPTAFTLSFDGLAPWAGAGATATWTPGLADGGVHVLLVDVRDPADPERVDTGSGEVSVADAWSRPGNVPVDPALYTSEWGLPVLHLLPTGPISEEYVSMDAWFDGVSYTGQMKIRGAASAGYPKPSYTLEFEPVQLHLVDAPDKDHLVLISNFDDQSHVRQRLVFESWAAMAVEAGEERLTPVTWPVVVYQSGRYFGLYLAVDHLDDEFVAEHGLDPAGNLFKSVTHDANFYLWNAAGTAKVPLSAGWEKKEGEPIDDFSDLDALTTWSATATDATFAAEVDTWLPRAEFMDWFLLVHNLACDDSAGKNAYLYHLPGAGNLYRYAPWDFNASIGQAWTTDRVPATTYNDFRWNNSIFAHFQDEPALAAELWARDEVLRADGAALSLTTQLGWLDAWAPDVADGADRDWERWEEDYRGYWYWRSDILDPAGETLYVREWLTDRAVFLATP